MYQEVFLLCYRWLNRRSQRASYTVIALRQALADHRISSICIRPTTRIPKPFLWTCV